MSSSKLGRAAAGLAILCGLTGCIRPLYGPTASGKPLREELAAIEVLPVNVNIGQERLAHNIRSELIFDLDGSGTRHEKQYRLLIDAQNPFKVSTTDAITGRADAALINASARFTLTSNDNRRILLTGLARATATYFRDPQRFASVRAARDAEIRAAKLIADDIKQRIAATLATTP